MYSLLPNQGIPIALATCRVNIRSFLLGYSMMRIASSMIGVAVSCICWNVGGAVAKNDIRPLYPHREWQAPSVTPRPLPPVRARSETPLDQLAKSTGSYISQAMACKTDEWKLALRQSIIEVQKRQPGSDLRYFQLVVDWANRYEARDCDQERLMTAAASQRIDLDRFIRDERDRRSLGCSLVFGGCNER